MFKCRVGLWRSLDTVTHSIDDENSNTNDENSNTKPRTSTTTTTTTNITTTTLSSSLLRSHYSSADTNRRKLRAQEGLSRKSPTLTHKSYPSLKLRVSSSASASARTSRTCTGCASSSSSWTWRPDRIFRDDRTEQHRSRESQVLELLHIVSEELQSWTESNLPFSRVPRDETKHRTICCSEVGEVSKKIASTRMTERVTLILQSTPRSLS